MMQACTKSAAIARGVLGFALLVVIAATGVRRAAADVDQDRTDGTYYVTNGPLLLRQMSMNRPSPLKDKVAEISLGQDVRILGPGLKFEIRYQAESSAPDDPKGTPEGTVYYVIGVPPIKSGTDTATPRDAKYITSDDKVLDFAISKSDFDRALTDGLIQRRYSTWTQGWKDVTAGASLKLPFKLRPRVELSDRHVNRQFSTDITLGGYVGYRTRISGISPYYLGLVATINLALLPIRPEEMLHSSPTAATTTTTTTTVPGVTFAGGVVLELGDFQVGWLVGTDYAGGSGNNTWIYNGKPWFALAIGYSFVGKPGE